jgi:hypothetical protein
MSLRLIAGAVLMLACVVTPASLAAVTPHIGYLYPAGGQQGTTFEVVVGGQHLKGATNALVTGRGVSVDVLQYVKPLTKKERNDLRKSMGDIQKARQKASREAERKNGKSRSAKGGRKPTPVVMADMEPDAWPADPRELDLKNMSGSDLKALKERLFNPKKQPNAQIDARVVLSVSISAKAKPGPREFRLLTAGGLSNPMVLRVGDFSEHNELEPNDEEGALVGDLPIVLNGQIMPGDVDRFRFRAKQGQRIVASARARSLIPYLADAVPGWFQAALALYDAEGRELAFVDDNRFDPDPILRYEIPQDGEYELLIRDAIYRGREDFVYRISMGELPFVEALFPLGGRRGAATEVAVEGWNLPEDHVAVKTRWSGPCIRHMAIPALGGGANRIAFAADSLSELLDKEPNNIQGSAQPVTLPIAINGRIQRPGDWDVFRFEGKQGDQVVAEVFARRLNSPVDSILRLTDAAGNVLAVNDDSRDDAAGLVTHHADSRLMVTLPAAGTYYVHLGDTQHAGSPAHAYRLRISPPQPDFKLRVMPSSINMLAGQTVVLSVAAIRQDGFGGEIALEVVEPKSGFTLAGGRIPEGEDRVWVTLTAPRDLSFDSVPMKIEGVATIAGREVRQPAVPAEDMMQAFLWRHLVPVEQLLVTGIASKWRRPPMRREGPSVVEFNSGETMQIGFRSAIRKKEKHLELDVYHPSEGFSVESVTPVEGGLDAGIQIAPEGLTPGHRGNLILEGFIVREIKNKNGKPTGKTRRIPLGILPAVPFEVVADSRLDAKADVASTPLE